MTFPNWPIAAIVDGLQHVLNPNSLNLTVNSGNRGFPQLCTINDFLLPGRSVATVDGLQRVSVDASVRFSNSIVHDDEDYNQKFGHYNKLSIELSRRCVSFHCNGRRNARLCRDGVFRPLQSLECKHVVSMLHQENDYSLMAEPFLVDYIICSSFF